MDRQELVRVAYQLMLGREPEEGVRAEFSDIWHLRSQFLASQEFRNQLEFWEFANGVYRHDAAFAAATHALETFLALDAETEGRIRDLLAEPKDEYSVFHQRRFFDQVRAVVAVATKALPETRPFRVLDIGLAEVAKAYPWVTPDLLLYGAHFDDGGGRQRHFITKYNLTDHYPINMERESLTVRYPETLALFDMVIFSETAEHLHMAPAEMIRDLMDVLKPGGIVFLTTPNGLGRRFVETMWGGTKNDIIYRRDATWIHDNGHAHVRCFTPTEMRSAAMKVGAIILYEGARDYYTEPHRHWLCDRYALARGALVMLLKKP